MSSFSLQASQWRVPLDDLSSACRILAQHLNLHDDENRRVQWDLHPRVIRYYTTLGLLDRALERRGKYMLYGARHLFQLLAIKKLQSQGLSLAQVQARLLGANDQEMAEFLEMPGGWLELVQEHQLQPPPPNPPPRPERTDFWMQPAPKPTSRALEEEAERLHRFRLPNGLEISVPDELFQRTDPHDWLNWLSQAPE